MAARAGHTEVAKYLLQNKAKANAKAKVSSGGRKGRVPGSLQPGEGKPFSEAKGSSHATPVWVSQKAPALLCWSPKGSEIFLHQS